MRTRLCVSDKQPPGPCAGYGCDNYMYDPHGEVGSWLQTNGATRPKSDPERVRQSPGCRMRGNRQHQHKNASMNFGTMGLGFRFYLSIEFNSFLQLLS